MFSIIFGSIGAIIMGSGMSLVMTDIGTTLGIANTMVFGILIGVVGIVLVCLAYTIYNCIIKKEWKKIASEILRLTDELLK